jgi:hypothetical protein
MKATNHLYAALKEEKQDDAFATQCEAIAGKLDGNPDVPNVNPAVTVILGHVGDYRTACKLAKGGPKGAVDDRNYKRGLLRSDMRQAKESVQAAADASPEKAAAIINGSGFTVTKRAPRVKAPIRVRYGKVPGVLIVEAKSVGRKASYYWQMSIDQAKWSDLPTTMVAKTLVQGLTPTTVYYFRVRTLTRAGLSDWSMAASIIAH